MRYVRVLIYEARRVVYLVVDHHVQILLRCVLADIGVRELLRLGHGRQRRRGARVCLCGGRVPVCCGIGMCRRREEEEEEDSRGRQHRCQLEVQRRRDKSVRR